MIISDHPSLNDKSTKSLPYSTVYYFYLYLHLTGLTCKALGLPDVSYTDMFELDQSEHTAADAEYAQQHLAILNPEQKCLVDTIISAIQDVLRGDNPKCRAFFLDGPGGTGKTMVYNTLMAALRADELKVILQFILPRH